MFGIKIISTKEYENLKAKERLLLARESFEQELDESATNQLSSLANLFILKGNTYPCQKCNIENQYCRKLHFADRTICVAPKDKIVTFPISEERKRRITKI